MVAPQPSKLEVPVRVWGASPNTVASGCRMTRRGPAPSNHDRTCKRCGTIYPAEVWHKNHHACPPCRAKEKREQLIQKRLAGERDKRAFSEECRANAKAYRARPEVKARMNEQKRRKREEIGEQQKIVARSRVYSAIRTGDVTPQPCARCGASPAHAHHEDYAKPLEVMWLCHIHHAERHLELRLAEKRAA